MRKSSRTLRTGGCDGTSLHRHGVTGVTGAGTRTRCTSVSMSSSLSSPGGRPRCP